ncbi:OFA family MFS transporter [Maribacter sp. 2307ULW6-5]|uniref:L-lactate MFS transporter n=1 Tax=Maribacter sp. 2307ULW6-5 TaxID=3386275 RepID=UPI0039BD2359
MDKTTRKSLKNRWLMVAAAVGIHISIGSVYAYSVMTNPVKDVFGVANDELKWAFKITILFMGFSAAFMGPWVQRVGPRTAGMVGGLFYGAGFLLSGLAVATEALWGFFVAYGGICGIGLGIAYITPIATLVKWFPDKKGLATGIVIMAFGFSALLFGPVMQRLFEGLGIAHAFYVLGVAYTFIVVVSSLYLAPPPANYVPKGYSEEKKSKVVQPLEELTPRQALGSKRFYLAWSMMFINIACGISLISAASPLMQEKLGYTPMMAAGMVGVMGIFNGLGRLVWSGLSDFWGRANMYVLFFLVQVLVFYFMPRVQAEVVFLSLLFVTISMFGGGFALLPSFLSDLFGNDSVGTLLGYLLTAKAIAGVVGPTVYDQLLSRTGSLEFTLSVFSGCFVLALLLSLVLKRSMTKERERQRDKS